jgi:hypothetical protein
MVDARTYTSSDQVLRFRVTRGNDGDVTLGFDGSAWHTHANLLVGWYGLTEGAAVHRFIEDLLQSRIIIAVVRREGTSSVFALPRIHNPTSARPARATLSNFDIGTVPARAKRQ